MNLDIKTTNVEKGIIFKKKYARVSVVIQLDNIETQTVKDNLEYLVEEGEIIVDPAEFNCKKIPIRIGHLEFGKPWIEDYDFVNSRDASHFVEFLKNQLTTLSQILKEYSSGLPEGGSYEL